MPYFPGDYLINNGTSTTPAQGLCWAGGEGMFVACGTYNGATISLQFLGPDAATWITAGAQTTLTSAGAGLFSLPPCNIRALVTGGPPSGIYALVNRVRLM